MRFAEPVYLLLLFSIIPVVLFSRGSGGRIRFSTLTTFFNIKAGALWHPRMILLVFRVIAITFFVLALARPQSGKKFSEVRSKGVDIMMAIDTSGSMRGLDFKIDGKRVDRLKIVKKVASEFIDKRAGDRLGLVVFGSESFTQCPLTLDHGIVVDFLKRMEIGMAGDATAIGSAIGTAVKRMKDLKSKSKIMILLTDGSNTAGMISPTKAAQIAKTFDIKIYTIGVGSTGQVPFLQDTIFGKRYIYQQANIDEPTLREIASTTGGKYYRATDSDKLAEIYDEIDKLEKTEVTVKEYTEYNELFHIFLILALVALGLEIVLGNTKLRKIP